jgi:hypothetical protein
MAGTTEANRRSRVRKRDAGGDQDRIICGWLTGIARRHASQILSDGGGDESRNDRHWTFVRKLADSRWRNLGSSARQ